MKVASSFGTEKGLERLPDGGGAFQPSRERIRQRRGRRLGGGIGLRLRFPADVDRDAQIPPFGKTLPTAHYPYAPDESALPEPVASFVAKIRQRLALDASFNIIKLSPPEYAISFLRYPEFLTEAHPAIAESVRIHLATGTVKRTDFTSHSNQPILHRKERFLWIIRSASPATGPPTARAA